MSSIIVLMAASSYFSCIARDLCWLASANFVRVLPTNTLDRLPETLFFLRSLVFPDSQKSTKSTIDTWYLLPDCSAQYITYVLLSRFMETVTVFLSVCLEIEYSLVYTVKTMVEKPQNLRELRGFEPQNFFEKRTAS